MVMALRCGMCRFSQIAVHTGSHLRLCFLSARSKKPMLYASCLQKPQCSMALQQCQYHSSNTDLQMSIHKEPNPEETLNDEELAALEIANLDSEMARKLKILQLELDVWQSFGRRVPDVVTSQQWLDILHNLNTVSSRVNNYKYLFKIEKNNENEKKRKEKNKVIHEKKNAERDRLMKDGTYEELNTIFIHVRDATMTKSYYSNIYHAMEYGPNLVMDMSFEQHMSKREMMQVTKQLIACHGANKVCRQPFHLHLCNMDQNSKINTLFQTKFPGFDKIPMTITEKSYLDLYPRERLVYLSPNSRNVLQEYNPDDVYIIGGIVDLGVEDPLTFSKAKRENIRCAKLPLDNYLRWRMGTKALTLDQMMKIMLTLQDTRGDWEAAFAHVPSRKIAAE